MKHRPIIFSAPMVKALLDGRKTQTRRILKNPDHFGCPTGDCPHWNQSKCDAYMALQSPFGVAGDRLWVRETFSISESAPDKNGKTNPVILYAADDPAIRYELKCRPSIFMPHAASRITLEITEVRAQLLHDISEEDAKAEGVSSTDLPTKTYKGWADALHTSLYERLWNQIHGPGSWAINPWVWALTFKRIT